jgi:hypothetical protein
MGTDALVIIADWDEIHLQRWKLANLVHFDLADFED